MVGHRSTLVRASTSRKSCRDSKESARKNPTMRNRWSLTRYSKSRDRKLNRCDYQCRFTSTLVGPWKSYDSCLFCTDYPYRDVRYRRYWSRFHPNGCSKYLVCLGSKCHMDGKTVASRGIQTTPWMPIQLNAYNDCVHFPWVASSFC